MVLEGRSPVYRWGSRFSIYTGLPTILGWDVHEGQQRTGYTGMLQERIGDVERAYSSTNPQDALDVLRKYQVRYVVRWRTRARRTTLPRVWPSSATCPSYGSFTMPTASRSTR